MEQIIQLKKGEFWKGSCSKSGRLEITCLEGVVWITQEGDAWDYCLETNTIFKGSMDGLVVVEGLNEENQLHISRKFTFFPECGGEHKKNFRPDPVCE